MSLLHPSHCLSVRYEFCNVFRRQSGPLLHTVKSTRRKYFRSLSSLEEKSSYQTENNSSVRKYIYPLRSILAYRLITIDYSLNMLAEGCIIIGFRFFNLSDFRFAHSPLCAVGKSIRLGKRRKSKHINMTGNRPKGVFLMLSLLISAKSTPPPTRRG